LLILIVILLLLLIEKLEQFCRRSKRRRFEQDQDQEQEQEQEQEYELEIELNVARLLGVLLVGARCVERHTGIGVARLDDFIVDQIRFDFLTADIGQHLAVNFDARRKRLATFRFHFPTKRWVLDNILLGIRQIVFCEHGTNAGAPAASGFQVSSNLRRIHLPKI
jgi:hypothetical protein